MTIRNIVNRKQKLTPGAVTVQKSFSHPAPQSHTEFLPLSSLSSFHHFYFSMDTHHSGHQVLGVLGCQGAHATAQCVWKNNKYSGPLPLGVWAHREPSEKRWVGSFPDPCAWPLQKHVWADCKCQSLNQREAIYQCRAAHSYLHTASRKCLDPAWFGCSCYPGVHKTPSEVLDCTDPYGKNMALNGSPINCQRGRGKSKSWDVWNYSTLISVQLVNCIEEIPFLLLPSSCSPKASKSASLCPFIPGTVLKISGNTSHSNNQCQMHRTAHL